MSPLYRLETASGPGRKGVRLPFPGKSEMCEGARSHGTPPVASMGVRSVPSWLTARGKARRALCVHGSTPWDRWKVFEILSEGERKRQSRAEKKDRPYRGSRVAGQSRLTVNQVPLDTVVRIHPSPYPQDGLIMVPLLYRPECGIWKVGRVWPKAAAC